MLAIMKPTLGSPIDNKTSPTNLDGNRSLINLPILKTYQSTQMK